MKDFDKILKIANRLANSILKGNRIEDIDDSNLLSKDDKKYIINNLTDPKKRREREDLVNNINKTKAKDWKKIKATISPKTKLRYLKILGRTAAILVGVLGLTYFYLTGNESETQSSVLKISSEDITLKLDNGNIEVINAEGESKILNKKGKVVRTQRGSSLIYEKNVELEKLVYNELNVPFGKKFQLQLSDGTLVHLNAGSSLKYPVKFISGQERQVFVKGEAYFEVAEDKNHPFVVNTNDLNIRVLGTKFNVSSYEEDKNINTVLVEGSVRLYNSNETYDVERSEELNPGFKASWSKSDQEISFKKVDTRLYTSWINGKLVFKNTPFKILRKKLERRYNVTIINNNKVLDEKLYNASFDIESIEQVLNSFSENYKINYTIVNNQIIIN